MNCAYHEQTPAIAVCAHCGRALCETCAIQWRDKISCKHCMQESGTAGKPRPVRMRKSPLFAGLLSLLPGAGQVYLGYYATGFIYVLIVGATISLIERGMRGLEPMLGMFISFFWIFNIIDAVRRAKLYNNIQAGIDRERVPTDSPLVAGIILLLLGAILTMEFTLGISVEFLEPVWPLAVLGLGVYFIGKYIRTRQELARSRRVEMPEGPAPEA